MYMLAKAVSSYMGVRQSLTTRLSRSSQEDATFIVFDMNHRGTLYTGFARNRALTIGRAQLGHDMEVDMTLTSQDVLHQQQEFNITNVAVGVPPECQNGR